MSFRIEGLYAITPDERDTVALLDKVRRAIAGGAKLVQYRNKAAPRALQAEQVRALLPHCRAGGVPLIVNDDLELALETQADGVHLGKDDGELARARALLGADRLLGASCYDRIELARRALEQGADHVAFGSVFGSPTKPGAVRAPLALFAAARRELAVPVVAIGGVTAENAAEAINAGADAVAVISALFGADDVEASARRIAALFGAFGAR
jgi:thiamine-phosphate pyrophosphorylase